MQVNLIPVKIDKKNVTLMLQFQVFRLKRTNINLEWCWSLLASVEHFDACGPQLRQLIETNEG